METSNRFEAAQSSEGRYRLLVEAITDYAIYMLDRDGHVTSWNPGARRFKGYEADEIIGHHFSTFYTDAERAQNVPCFGAGGGRAHRPLRARGLARAQGRHAVLGPCRHRRDPLA